MNESFDGPKCGLIPFACGNNANGVCVKSKGLKWNLNGEKLYFGADVFSSSNEFTSNSVEIDVSQSIMFTFEFHLPKFD